MADMSLENERFVERLVASGQFASRHAVLEQAVGLLREQVQPNGDDVSGNLTAPQWCDRFEQSADSHQAIPREADDSRENIYAVRGGSNE
jgi:Arc/MetJ-type ribon-helix-helix transcriptional regulator